MPAVQARGELLFGDDVPLFDLVGKADVDRRGAGGGDAGPARVASLDPVGDLVGGKPGLSCLAALLDGLGLRVGAGLRAVQEGVEEVWCLRGSRCEAGEVKSFEGAKVLWRYLAAIQRQDGGM